jgi:hypothetical protein
MRLKNMIKGQKIFGLQWYIIKTKQYNE